MTRVLVVDDEPVIRALVAATLEPIGMEVESAADGPSGIDLARATAPDVVLIDVGLPGLSGTEVLRRLRDDPDTASIPVLLLTGVDPESSDGADGVVRKPFTLERLRESVSKCLRK
jgi:CheY-like chemotaxis protein